MNSKKYEVRPISLIDLFWRIIMSWRRLLAWAVVFTILATVFGGWSYRKEQKVYQKELASYKSESEGASEQNAQNKKQKKKFTKEELRQIDDAVDLQERIARSRNYLENSILMDLDAYVEDKLTLSFYVDSEYTFNYTEDNKLDYTDSLVSAYVGSIETGKLAKQLKKELGLDCDVKYVQELLSAWRDGRILYVTMVYKDAENFDDASKVIQKFMNAQIDDFSHSYGPHTLKFVSEQQDEVLDSDLANLQVEKKNSLTSFREQYKTLTASMSDKQKKQLRIKLNQTAEKVENLAVDELTKDLEELEEPEFSLMYPVLGFIGGIFLACGWIVMLFVLNNKLEKSQDLKEYFGLKRAGTVFQDKKRLGLDAFLWKCKTRNQKTMDHDTSLDLVISNVELMCQKAQSKAICLTGTEIEKMADVDVIAQKLEQCGITVHVCGDVCYDQKAMRKAAEIGFVVVMEQVGVSIYREIDRQLERLSQNGIEVLGAIGVE